MKKNPNNLNPHPGIIIITTILIQEYERAVIFRLGLLLSGGARGPGVHLFIIIIIILIGVFLFIIIILIIIIARLSLQLPLAE